MTSSSADLEAFHTADSFPSRRTPRRSVVVVIPNNHSISVERVADRISTADDERVDVIVACAGRPANLDALTERIRDLEVLLAPAGTSDEDLRALGMKQTRGDVVTLLSGGQAGPAPA